MDAFQVWEVTGHFPGSPTHQYTYDYFAVNWNFRDNYVNGSAPDDAVGLAMTDYDNACYEDPAWLFYARRYDGSNANEFMWIHSSSYNSIIYNVRDRASGFVLTTDHGSAQVFMYYKFTDRECDRGGLRGNGYFEHNQDGDGGFTATVGMWGMELSYSGAPGSVLQKGTGLMNPFA